MAEKRAWKSGAATSAVEDDDRRRLQVEVERVAQLVGVELACRDRHAPTWPSACTPASVRPAAMHRRRSRRRVVEHGLFERLLHRQAVVLALPADEGAAVIFEVSLKRVTRSDAGRRAARAKPRRNSSAAHRRAAGALHQRSAAARPAPQAMVSRSSSDRAGRRPRRRQHVGRQHLDALAADRRNQAPGPGEARAPAARAPAALRRQSSAPSSRVSLAA